MKDAKTKIRQEQLIEEVSSFCDDKLDEEYRQLSINLIEKMGRKHEVPFKRGKIEIWASAVIYALGQINFLFDRSFEPYSTPDEICDYFNTKKSTVSNKARMIRDMFNLEPFDREFSTSYIKGEAPRFTIDEKTGMIVPVSDIDKFFDDVYELFERGEIDKALSELDTIDENHPEYPRALFYKSVIMGAAGNQDEGRDLFYQALSNEFGEDFEETLEDSIDYNNPEELFTHGRFCYEMGDYSEAVEFFDSSLKLDSKNSETIYYKALSLAGMGEFKKAVKSIDKAIKINPDDDRFWNDKGNFLTKMNHVNKALKCFDKAIKLNPDDYIIWSNKGFLYLENEKYDKSLECYEKSCKLAPGEIHPIIGKVNVYIAKDELENAQKCLDEASIIDDEDLEYLSAAAQLELSKKDYKKAIEYWDKCIEIDDENGMLWVQKAFTYGLWKKVDKFEECLDKAIEIDPDVMYVVEDFLSELDD